MQFLVQIDTNGPALQRDGAEHIASAPVIIGGVVARGNLRHGAVEFWSGLAKEHQHTD